MIFEPDPKDFPQFRTVDEHLKSYWLRCRRLFNEGDFPLAAFCAITLIEEVGKARMLGLQTLVGGRQTPETEKSFNKAFLSHRQKFIIAVMETLFINSRVSRVYGPAERTFAGWYRDKQLFQIRNSALYLSLDDGHVVAPSQAITTRDAYLLVCFAGEIYAETQGNLTNTGPDAWQSVLREIDDFRSSHAEIGDELGFPKADGA